MFTSFTATTQAVDAGTPVSLTWVLDAQTPLLSLEMDPGQSVLGQTSVVVSPLITTHYTFRSEFLAGLTTTQITVTVKPIPTQEWDADLADWFGGVTLINEADDVAAVGNHIDLLRMHVWITNRNLRLAYENQPPIQALDSAYNMYFDVDDNPAAGSPSIPERRSS